MKENWLRILDAARDLTGDEPTWLAGLAGAAQPALDCGMGVFAYFFDIASAPKTFGCVGTGVARTAIERAQETNSLSLAELPSLLGVTLSSRSALYGMRVARLQQPERAAADRAGLELPPETRLLLLSAVVEPGRGCVLATLDPDGSSKLPSRKTFWTGIACEIAAAMRLRWNLAIARREECAQATPAAAWTRATPRDVLREASRTAGEASVPSPHADSNAGVALWNELLAGRWSLVDRFDRDGRQIRLVHRNAARDRTYRALSVREREVVSYAARAYSNKAIGAEIGLSLGTVASHLRSALLKLGLESRVELVWLAAALQLPAAGIARSTSIASPPDGHP